MARCKDHHGLWMIGQDVAKRRKQRAFFAFERAATHQNRPRSGVTEALTKTRNNLRRWRRSNIEFQVAGDRNFRFRRANFYETLPVFLCLSQKNIDVRERLLQQLRQPEPEPLVAGKRAVRNAAVDNRDASSRCAWQAGENSARIQFRQRPRVPAAEHRGRAGRQRRSPKGNRRRSPRRTAAPRVSAPCWWSSKPVRDGTEISVATPRRLRSKPPPRPPKPREPRLRVSRCGQPEQAERRRTSGASLPDTCRAASSAAASRAASAPGKSEQRTVERVHEGSPILNGEPKSHLRWRRYSSSCADGIL